MFFITPDSSCWMIWESGEWIIEIFKLEIGWIIAYQLLFLNEFTTEEIELSSFKSLLVVFLLTIICISKDTSSWMNCEHWNRNVEIKNDITTIIMNWFILSNNYHNISLLSE